MRLSAAVVTFVLVAWVGSAGAAEQMAALDVEALERLATKADRLIDDCKDGTLECWSDDARVILARAYLVRVTHRRVVFGRVDQQGAANARYLVPLMAEEWRDVLPSDDGTMPEEWLFDLELTALAAKRAERDEPPPPPPRDALDDFSEPDLVDIDMDRSWGPSKVRAAVSLVGQLGVRPGHTQPGTTLTGGPELSPEGRLFATVALSKRVVLRGGLDYRYVHLNSPTEIQRLTAVSPEDQASSSRSSLLATESMTGNLGLGARLGRLERHEILVWGALDVSTGGFTRRTNTDLWSDYGYLASPGFAGLGPRIGAGGSHSLGPEHHWAVTWSAQVGAEKRWTHVRYVAPNLPFEFPRAGEEALFPDGLTRDDTAADRLVVEADLMLRFRPVAGVTISLGPALRLQTDLASEEASVAWFGTRVPVAETAIFVMPRAGVTMLLR